MFYAKADYNLGTIRDQDGYVHDSITPLIVGTDDIPLLDFMKAIDNGVIYHVPLKEIYIAAPTRIDSFFDLDSGEKTYTVIKNGNPVRSCELCGDRLKCEIKKESCSFYAIKDEHWAENSNNRLAAYGATEINIRDFFVEYNFIKELEFENIDSRCILKNAGIEERAKAHCQGCSSYEGGSTWCPLLSLSSKIKNKDLKGYETCKKYVAKPFAQAICKDCVFGIRPDGSIASCGQANVGKKSCADKLTVDLYATYQPSAVSKKYLQGFKTVIGKGIFSDFTACKDFMQYVSLLGTTVQFEGQDYIVGNLSFRMDGYIIRGLLLNLYNCSNKALQKCIEYKDIAGQYGGSIIDDSDIKAAAIRTQMLYSLNQFVGLLQFYPGFRASTPFHIQTEGQNFNILHGKQLIGTVRTPLEVMRFIQKIENRA